MKKEYVKPYIAVESFQLNAAIAAGCSNEDGKTPINYNLDDCTAVEELGAGMTYIGNACVHDVKVEGDGNDAICYHGPTPVATLFLNS